MTPAFKSASMDICLPGIASKVKRAFTSDTRPAPLVTTMKLMIIKIEKMMNPTASLPPITELAEGRNHLTR
jgi:hypothetical protein